MANAQAVIDDPSHAGASATEASDEQQQQPVPVLAQIGMFATVMTTDGEAYGPIVGMGEDYCVIRNASEWGSDDDAPGCLIARAWEDVTLRCVRPAPATPAAARVATPPARLAWQWEDVSKPANGLEGARLSKRYPVNATPALACPGMVVELSNGSDTAVVEHVLPELCICRDEKGETHALYWHEVAIGLVAPDLAADPAMGRDKGVAFAEAIAIRDAIEAAGQTDTHEYKLLRDATAPDDPDSLRLMFAIENFYAQPNRNRHRLLGGWAHDRMPTWEEAKLLWSQQPHQRRLVLEAGPNNVDATFRVAPEDGIARVAVHIRPGTTKADALAYVEELHSVLDGRWDDLITDPAGVDLTVVVDGVRMGQQSKPVAMRNAS